MVIVWSKRAQQDLDALVAYIARESPKGAKRVAARIKKRVDDLALIPDQGSRIGRDIRRLDVTQTPYIVLHKRKSDTVTVIAILHGRRQRRS